MVCIKESEAEEDDKTCQLSRLYVHPDCRRLGISNRLLQEAKIEALKIGYKRMQVDITLRTLSHTFRFLLLFRWKPLKTTPR